MSLVHDCWIIDFGASDHMTNQTTKLHDFANITKPSLVFGVNGKGTPVLGTWKIKLTSDNIESKALYVPSFAFQLLSVGKITKTLDLTARAKRKTLVEVCRKWEGRRLKA